MSRYRADMTTGAPTPHRDCVTGRPCTGRLSAAGEPRHPRPAGAGLRVNALYAADYGVRGHDGLVDLDLGPMLDLIAARYDGCTPCESHHTDRIAGDPALATHVVGVALRTLADLDEPPARLVIQKLDPAGAAIALTMRVHGLRAAVAAAAGMPVDRRRSAVVIALGKLVPSQHYGDYLGNHYAHGRTDRGDEDLLEDLRDDGYLSP
jgi:hypothetical protein